jgi:hypothetical protein
MTGSEKIYIVDRIAPVPGIRVYDRPDGDANFPQTNIPLRTLHTTWRLKFAAQPRSEWP